MKLRIGNYVRTDNGIGKIINFEGDLISIDLGYRITIDYKSQLFSIIKASDKLIDLVEIGDYVNGREVVDLFYNANNKIIGVETRGSVDYVNEEIKSIVTKEQFDQMSYKLGE